MTRWRGDIVKIQCVYVCDYRRGMVFYIGFSDHFYTPLGTTLYKSLIHIDYCPQSVAVSTSRFLATASIERDSSASRTQVLLSQPHVQNSCQLTTRLTWVPG
jgi:hypothetical protein